MSRSGPERGSTGAQRISAAHKGSHEHDKGGGFAANPELAKLAGKKGGEAIKKKYGKEFFREIGKKGGNILKQERGSEFYSKIGKMGGKVHAEQLAAKKRGKEQVDIGNDCQLPQSIVHCPSKSN